jgi:TusA-related sulfurtransferase
MKLQKMKSGKILEIISTDRGINKDMLAWCKTTGNEFLGIKKEGEIFKVYVRKK